MRRPVSSFLAATAVLLVMASPVIDLRTANTSLSQLRSRRGGRPGLATMLQRAVTGPGQGTGGAARRARHAPPGSEHGVDRPRSAALAVRVAADPDIIGPKVTLQPVGSAIEIDAPLRVNPG